MSKELEKNYNPSEIEDRLYQKWLDKKYFHAEVNRDKKPFTIVMPPPNITGKLHMGHALDNTMQDIIIRFKRMQGYEALWVPGTDHASISTEVKVTNALKEEGIDKHELGREGFLKRTWEWKKEYGGTITSQLRKIGSSCDWDRERFTMDDGCSKAVLEVFCKLYEKGLIYKGSRIVNCMPVEIVELDAVKCLMNGGFIAITVGGGGIPVIKDENGNYIGTAAVIDKDLASERLAEDIDADALVILTAVEQVCINFGKPEQKSLSTMTVEEARRYMAEGHFAPGSMLPKVEAAVKFVESKPGRKAIITSLDKAVEALEGKAGTTVC